MKRILVISDIHANLTALEAVLQNAGAVDAVWCLGDVVGYGPDPNECIARLKMLPNFTCLMGNHDAATLGHIQLDAFNYDARRSIEWIRNILTPESTAFLTDLPENLVMEAEDVTLVHGSPRNPVWEYILDLHSASQNFKHFTTRVCMVGHTHLPIAYLMENADGDYFDLEWVLPEERKPLSLPLRSIVNPGSVGQPRDHDPRASYAIFAPNTVTWEIHRVEYDIPSVQKRIQQLNLPSRHAQRLTDGW
jgi:predicted phosphodiesterase